MRGTLYCCRVSWHDRYGRCLEASFEAKPLSPYDPAVLPMGIYRRKMNVDVPQDLYKNVHSRAFIMAKHWKQSKCSPTVDWTEFCYIHRAVY